MNFVCWKRHGSSLLWRSLEPLALGVDLKSLSFQSAFAPFFFFFSPEVICSPTRPWQKLAVGRGYKKLWEFLSHCAHLWPTQLAKYSGWWLWLDRKIYVGVRCVPSCCSSVSRKLAELCPSEGTRGNDLAPNSSPCFKEARFIKLKCFACSFAQLFRETRS